MAWIFGNLNAPSGAIGILCLIGIIRIILGIFLKKERLEVVVVRFSTSLKFEGSRTDLDQVLKIIREI